MVYDCIIVGGGPAGLSAAIYLTRYNRTVLVLDKGFGRWNTREINENYLGFPKGIHTRVLRQRGKLQALNFGTEYHKEKVLRIGKEEDIFAVSTKDHTFRGKRLIIATGVKDLFPSFDKSMEYIGKSVFWCITCDGHKTLEKNVVIIGCDNDAAITCFQFLDFTKKLIFLTNRKKGDHKISGSYLKEFKKHKIPFYEGELEKVNGRNGNIENIELSDGIKIETELIFSCQGATPNSELAQSIGIDCDKKDYIKTNKDKLTNIKNVYAVGDITNHHTHQIAVAVAEGAIAAEAINFSLYSPLQQGEI